MPIHIQEEPSRSSWDINFTLLGVPIRIHPLFWLFTFMIAYSPKLEIQLVLLLIPCMFVSILVHEYGHIFCQKHYGVQRNHITFHAFGGLAVADREIDGYWPRVFVSLWGPLAGFILSGVAYVVGGLIYGWSFPWGLVILSGSYYWFWITYQMFWLGVLWGGFNLLPIYPLDGGKILQATGKRKRKPDSWTYRISGIVAVIVAVLAGVSMLIWPETVRANWLLLLMCAAFAFNNFYLVHQINKFGGDSDGAYYEEVPEKREAWEQDPDWWKQR